MAVTDNDVIWCYRSLLGREPESPQTIHDLIGAADDFRSLVLIFLRSAEYRNNGQAIFVPLSEGRMEVDVTASTAELLRLQDRIRTAWTHLGAARPHHSVLTADEYLAEAIDDRTIAQFYESGKVDAAVIDAMLSRHGFSSAKTSSCVEYGCGLGRVTMLLSQRFAMVHAYDISSNHIALAQKRAQELAVQNVEFHLCEVGVGDQALEPCDLFFSCIVFQHNPPPIIRAMISSALRSLRPGGIAIFQVPTFGAGYAFRLQQYLNTVPHLDIEMHCIPQQAVFALIAEQGCTLLEVREDGWVGAPGKWISNTFVVRRPDQAQQ